ncbi:Molybdopterin molybdenumtransferase [Neomoorella glycerini]|uniref:Molybdopterin molybdenumtransferase n=1 Tax=Neomoorella glycerini TaxID=55779 RepID=A0A6I5ZM16_9FIRM|nr:molybdopterin molybdotransferase MoeA [Moorella glycerini]QGP90924.1 Molybdopterin molybdenumtransferase [Moorella glycerini]
MSPLSLEAARALLLAGLKPPGRVKVKLEEAAGRVLAAAVTAPGPFPPFPRSLVDGYALGPPVAAPGTLPTGLAGPGVIYRLLGTVPAGSNSEITLSPGTAAAIFTGARPPVGTVAIIPRELVGSRGDFISVPGLPPGRHLEPVGAEVAAGEEVLAAGTTLGPAEIGLLAALGLREVLVYQRPRVVLATSGSELLDPAGKAGPPAGSQAGYPGVNVPPCIYNSNFYALAAAVEAAGGRVISLGPLADNLEEQVRAYRSALEEGDLLLTTGGAGGSAGDYTAAAFTRAGGEVLFTELNIRPGRRIIAARAGEKLMLGLPGNPPAALVACYLLARPVIRALGGREPAPVTFPARLAAAIDRPRVERAFLWAQARASGSGWEVTPLPRRPGGIRAAIGANALIDLPPGTAPGPGEEVTVIILS